ncbi:MAG: membrane dipeptidase [Myxococcales bacterium]|nr:membrane dipeptidase [Myxococcales bacterium]
MIATALDRARPGRVLSLALAPALALALACNPAPAGDTESGGSESGGSESDGDPPPLAGFADLHLHMFAEDAFGGGWLHGEAVGDPAIALALCDGGEPGDHGRIRDGFADLIATCDQAVVDEASSQAPLLAVLLALGGAELSELLGDIPGSAGDTGKHDDRTRGWPELDGWPRWDVIAHQQSWEGWLRDAYDDGLRVEIVSAVSLDWLCKALPPENLARPQCDEMADVRVQLEKANAFAAANAEWVEIALSAADARRIVGEDKLALILSIEASHIFGDGDWQAQLDEVWDLGVRTLQMVHQLDNRFGGAAPHNTIFHVAQFSESCHIDTDCGITDTGVTLGFDVDANCRNVRGLTDEGRALLEAMIERGMLIDLAHMSEALVRDVHAVAVEHDYYPLYFSHAHFREIMLPAKQKEEKTTPASIVAMVRETGGMIGLRTAHEEVNTYEPSPVENTCHGSSRSFAQAHDLGRLGLKVKLGLGSDFNGFIQQTRPRLGADACSASFAEEATCQAKGERDEGLAPVGSAFDDHGLGHVGLLGDLLDDLDQHGSDTTQIRSSADDFVRMWERASGERSGPADDPADLDVSGITVLPSHGVRRAEYPTECDKPYCPGGLVSGDACRFDAECESGACAGAGDCGMPRGVCE